MTEPSTTPIGAAWAAWFTAVVLAYLGVDYYALLGAFGGVLATLSALRTVGLVRMIWTVATTSFVAAVLGQGLAALLGLNARPVVMVFSLVFGAAGQVAVQTAVEAMLARIRRLGGDTGADAGGEAP